MRCPKCQGLMFRSKVPADTIILTVFSCINCGNKIEPGLIPEPIYPAAQGRAPHAVLKAPRTKGHRPSQRRATGPVWI